MAEDTGFLSRWSRRKAQAQAQKTPDALPDEPPPGTPGKPVLPPAAMSAATAAQPQARQLPQPPLPGAGTAVLPASATTATTSTAPAATSAQPATVPPPPTLKDAQALTPQSQDFSRFVGRGVDPQVRHTALKTLFSDPHFNVMDRLDIYIDDYNTPDPLPPGMLRQMVQSSLLGLFDDEDATAAKPDAAAEGSAAANDGAAQPEPVAGPDRSHAVGNASKGTGNRTGCNTDNEAASTCAAPFPQDTPPDHEDPAVRLQPNDDAGPAGHQPGPGPDAGRQR